MTDSGLCPDPQVLARLRSLARDVGMDGVIAMSQDNVTYTLGVGVPSHRLIRERRVAVLVPLDGPLAVVSVTVEESFLQAHLTGVDIRPYDEHAQSAMAVLADLLAERGLDRAHLGLEMDVIAAQDYAELTRRLPAARFEDASMVFKRSRWVKTAREVDQIRRGGRLADASVREAFTSVRAGITERALAAAMADAFLRQGGDDVRLVVVGAGERSSHPNAPPTDRILRPGDVVRVDFLGTVGGYYTDCARTAVVGEATAEQAAVYRSLVEIHREVLARLRPGVRTRELYALYHDRASRRRLQPLRFLGHGLGLGLHEGPFIDAHTDVTVEPGMVFAIEPVHFVPHQVGFHLEDMVVVTPTGAEVVTDVTPTDSLWVIPA
ncbi:MAG: Xaa-Pro peptidase family protein [Armatimonadota bacterium]|nr:Xaa-Pro peptidase family protein [Armatimonadota bacterium]